MDVFGSPLFQQSPEAFDDLNNLSPTITEGRRAPPFANPHATAPTGQNPLNQIMTGKWIIPVCTIVVIAFFVGIVWLWSNYWSEKSSSSKLSSKKATPEYTTPKAARKKSYKVLTDDRTTPF